MKTNATRMNLINTRKRTVIARKGHSLLKTKREVLVIELFKLLKQSTKGRNQLNAALDKAYKRVVYGATYVGDHNIQSSSMLIEEPQNISISIRNVMGVRVPEIYKTSREESLLKRGYGILSTSASIDDIYDSFTDTLDIIMDVAKREEGIKRLAIEIEKVKRRVNVLEYVRIPELKSTSKYISMRLDEMDRDTFSALKHIKKRLQKKQ